MNILDKLADTARERYAERRRAVTIDTVKSQALELTRGGFEFENAINKNGLSFICEVKRASPSKGLISPDFPYLQIAREYERGGAAAISVLTEPSGFMGRDEYLQQIASQVNVPVLRKDFTVDEYQIYEAKLLGAAAVLLICSILSECQIHEYICICDSLGMSALVEAHSAQEIRTAVNAGARVIGVNNRDLTDFSVSTSHSAKLRALVPEGIAFVSESGVKSLDDVRAVKRAGADAVLIGEALMRADNRVELLLKMRNCV